MKKLNRSRFDSQFQTAPETHSVFRSLQPLLWSLFSIIAAVIFTAHLSAAPPPPDTKANLVLFDFGDAKDKKIRENAIARFNKRYPNVKVVDQFIRSPRGQTT